MGREIKFRAYGHVTKKLHYFDLLEYTIMNESGQEDVLPTGQNISLMQYTGLKDKNGKEIYEGDILGIDLGVTGIVKYDDGGTSFYLDVIEYLDVFEVEDGEQVIGNIYENPELLEVQ